MTSILALAIRITALFIAVLALGDRSRPTVLGLIALALVVLRLARLPELAEWRRLWRNSDDPTFQGDGWRWTLSLLLPDLLLRRKPDGYPVTLHDLPLTRAQRHTCWLEWALAQEEQERLGRPLERWETIEREGNDG